MWREMSVACEVVDDFSLDFKCGAQHVLVGGVCRVTADGNNRGFGARTGQCWKTGNFAILQIKGVCTPAFVIQGHSHSCNLIGIQKSSSVRMQILSCIREI